MYRNIVTVRFLLQAEPLESGSLSLIVYAFSIEGGWEWEGG